MSVHEWLKTVSLRQGRRKNGVRQGFWTDYDPSNSNSLPRSLPGAKKHSAWPAPGNILDDGYGLLYQNAWHQTDRSDDERAVPCASFSQADHTCTSSGFNRFLFYPPRVNCRLANGVARRHDGGSGCGVGVGAQNEIEPSNRS